MLINVIFKVNYQHVNRSTKTLLHHCINCMSRKIKSFKKYVNQYTDNTIVSNNELSST